MQYRGFARVVLAGGALACALVGQDVVKKTPMPAGAPSEQKATAVDREPVDPAVDSALRDRVTKFFQAHVDGKFRQAEQYVAEDSRDAFYELDKRRFLKFEIERIDYKENFTKAEVHTLMDLEWKNSRFGTLVMHPPMTSYWRVDNGQWFWYFNPTETVDTPWGKRVVETETLGGGVPGMANGERPALPPGARKVSAEEVLQGVKFENNVAVFDPGKVSEAKLTVKNTMPGEVQLKLNLKPSDWLTGTIDKTTLKPGETATVTLQYKPGQIDAMNGAVGHVHVEPTGQDLSMQVLIGAR